MNTVKQVTWTQLKTNNMNTIKQVTYIEFNKKYEHSQTNNMNTVKK